MRSRSRLRDLLTPAAAAVALAWVVTLSRVVPAMSYDHGTFVSVAERLRAGDRLYAEVWDNKDPLFFYLLALGRSISPYADIALEVVWLLLAAASVTVVGRWLGLDRSAAAVAGFAVTPLAVAGASWLPGLTHLPGVALCLAILAAAVSRRFALAGVVLALLLLVKLVLAPLGLALLLVAGAGRRRWSDLGTAGAAAGVTAAAGVGVMLVRDEWSGYLRTQRLNVTYSQGELVETRWGEAVGHLLRVVPEGYGDNALVTLAAIALVVVAGWRGGLDPRPRARTLWLACAATLVVGVGVVALTGIWPHHAQVFGVAGALAGLLVVAHVASARALGWRQVLMLLLVGYVLGGAVHPAAGVHALADTDDLVAALARRSDLVDALAALGTPGSYARVGIGDDSGHAIGLGAWELACPRFQQYPFEGEEVFEEVIQCLPSADVIVVHRSAVPYEGDAAWNAFVAAVERVLSHGYACTAQETGRVCTRRPD